MWDRTTVESMHTDVFYHLFWQSLSLSKWARPLSMGPRVKAVHREFPKRGRELLLNSLQAVISAAGEATLIFFVWQISNIMHCQIILNTLSVTRRTCSPYSDLLWLINSTATVCHWTINQDIPPPHPYTHTPTPQTCTSSDSSSPVSLFEYEVALGWLPQNKPLGEHAAWRSCSHMSEFWLSKMHNSPVPTDLTTPLTTVRGLFQIYLHIILIALWSRGLFL